MQSKSEETILLNPQGLDQILSEILCHPVHGDWDKDISQLQYIGTLKEAQKEGRIGDFWGTMMQDNARDYLAKNLQQLGWNLKSEKIHGHEYDCIGRIRDSSNKAPRIGCRNVFPST